MFPDIIFLLYFAKHEAENNRQKQSKLDPKLDQKLKLKYSNEQRHTSTYKTKKMKFVSCDS